MYIVLGIWKCHGSMDYQFVLVYMDSFLPYVNSRFESPVHHHHHWLAKMSHSPDKSHAKVFLVFVIIYVYTNKYIYIYMWYHWLYGTIYWNPIILYIYNYISLLTVPKWARLKIWSPYFHIFHWPINYPGVGVAMKVGFIGRKLFLKSHSPKK